MEYQLTEFPFNEKSIGLIAYNKRYHSNNSVFFCEKDYVNLVEFKNNEYVRLIYPYRCHIIFANDFDSIVHYGKKYDQVYWFLLEETTLTETINYPEWVLRNEEYASLEANAIQDKMDSAMNDSPIKRFLRLFKSNKGK